MNASVLYALKRKLRIWDSRCTPRKRTIDFRGHRFTFFVTYWWSDVSQSLFETEIAPYFAALRGDSQPAIIVDVGAATGHFAIPAAKLFPHSTVYAFEPSERQRILLERNARVNQTHNLKVEPYGLWNCADQLAFRTNGAESSFESVSRFQGKLPFLETVAVRPLDQWARERQIPRLDLVKMDAEGAEIEILEGATQLLQRDHPALLIQAYHLRDGTRTFEKCAELLGQLGYSATEKNPPSGLLLAEQTQSQPR